MKALEATVEITKAIIMTYQGGREQMLSLLTDEEQRGKLVAGINALYSALEPLSEKDASKGVGY